MVNRVCPIFGFFQPGFWGTQVEPKEDMYQSVPVLFKRNRLDDVGWINPSYVDV
jgi:hypothetical protein